MDLMALEKEPLPYAGQELVVHVLGQLDEATTVVPTTVESLHRTYFRDGQVRGGSGVSSTSLVEGPSQGDGVLAESKG